MGIVFSTIGSFLGAIGRAIVTIINAIVGVIVDFFYLLAGLVDAILCCRCFGSRRGKGRGFSRRHRTTRV